MGSAIELRGAGRGYVAVAPAKVNLFLDLHGKRPDGYHEISTLLTCISLYDTLEVQPASDLRLTCDTPGIPTDSRNLVMKAAEALREAFAIGAGAEFHLTKRIPHEAGLGGGSSDAAAAILALNQLWNLRKRQDELIPVAAKVGSDVAAFLGGPACWCTGRGEVITPVESKVALHLVVVKPQFGLSTAAVYGKVANTVASLTLQPAMEILTAFASGDPVAIAAQLFNRLQPPAFGLQPLVKTVYDGLTACEPLGVLLSGSGSSVFALARDAGDARRIARDFAGRQLGSKVYAVRTLT